jgi:hypothetical protein
VYEEVQDYRNLSDKSSLPKSEMELSNYVFSNITGNQNIEIYNTPFEPKLPLLSNEVEYLEELDQRPVDDHFNSEKGYKFDVEVKDNEKYRIENIRLGDPDVLPNPYLTLLR